jgi:hypothetical protein
MKKGSTLPEGMSEYRLIFFRESEMMQAIGAFVRQQKQPPTISSTGMRRDRASAVSTSPPPWSLVISPTRSPRAVSPSANRRQTTCRALLTRCVF